MSAVAVATTRSRLRNRVYVAPQRNSVLNVVFENQQATAADCGVGAPYMILLKNQGLLRQVGTVKNGKPGRPAVLYALTDKGRKRVQRARATADRTGSRR